LEPAGPNPLFQIINQLRLHGLFRLYTQHWTQLGCKNKRKLKPGKLMGNQVLVWNPFPDLKSLICFSGTRRIWTSSPTRFTIISPIQIIKHQCIVGYNSREDSLDHFIRNCDKPKNLLRNVANQIKFNPVNIRQNLFEVCLQTEDAMFKNEADEYSSFFTTEEMEFTVVESQNTCFHNTENIMQTEIPALMYVMLSIPKIFRRRQQSPSVVADIHSNNRR
jgi:hypothetical protein